MPDPLDLFTPRPQRRPSIEERFLLFHAQHPEVFELLRALALEAVRAGRKRLGIAALWERMRWEYDLKAKDGDGFKGNNSFRALYARALMATEPMLAGVFELRERRTA